MRLVLILLALTPAIAQTPAPLGRLVDVGGYRVHLYCTGQGSPTVFVTGGGYSVDWALVQPEVAKFTRICTYDPAGSAWSEPGPSATCPERVTEIRKLLRAAGIPGPYVLTGLSVGATVARFYASRYPDEVAGMVMVDHAFLNPGVSSAMSKPASTPGLDSPPVLIEQTPLNLTTEDTSNFNNLPPRIRALHRWAASHHPYPPAAPLAEGCVAAVGSATLGNMPLRVVSTLNDAPNYSKLQAELLALSTNSRQLIADESFHSVEIDQPDAVVSAIRQVVQEVRQMAHVR